MGGKQVRKSHTQLWREKRRDRALRGIQREGRRQAWKSRKKRSRAKQNDDGAVAQRRDTRTHTHRRRHTHSSPPITVQRVKLKASQYGDRESARATAATRAGWGGGGPRWVTAPSRASTSPTRAHRHTHTRSTGWSRAGRAAARRHGGGGLEGGGEPEGCAIEGDEWGLINPGIASDTPALPELPLPNYSATSISPPRRDFHNNKRKNNAEASMLSWHRQRDRRVRVRAREMTP